MPKFMSDEGSPLRFLLPFLGRRRGLFALASLCLLAASAAQILQAEAAAALIDAARSGGRLLPAAGLFAASVAASVLSAWGGAASRARLGARAGEDLKNALAGSLLRAAYLDVAPLRAGDALQTVQRDVRAVCDFFQKEGMELLGHFVVGAAALGYLLALDPRLALITLAYLPVGLCSTLWINRRMNALYPERAERAAAALSAGEQALSAVPLIKSFQMQAFLRRQMESRGRELQDTQRKIGFWNGWMQPACSLTSNVPRLLYLLLGGTLVMRGSLTLGVYVAALGMVEAFVGPVVYFPFLMNGYNRAMASARRVRRLLRLPAALPAAPLGGEEPGIRLEGVWFAYPEKPPVLRGASWSRAGVGLIALAGPSGVGKTTLLDLLAGLLRPDAGEVSVSGKVAALEQAPFVFPMSGRENIRLGRPSASDAEVEAAAAMAGASEFLEAIGYETPLGEGGRPLSGGEAQRLQLARVWLSGAPVWLLDEPTSALDAESEKRLVRVLREAAGERLVLVCTHRPALLAAADCVLRLEGGTLREG